MAFRATRSSPRIVKARLSAADIARMTCRRLALFGAVACACLGGCSDDEEPAGVSTQGAGGEYPVVGPETETIPREVTTLPNGTVVYAPPAPSAFQVEPSASCERIPLANGPPYVAPPRPGLSARRADQRTVEVSWRFRSLPADCRPVRVELKLRGSPGEVSPYQKEVRVAGTRGTTSFRLDERYSEPVTAQAGAESEAGFHSSNSKVRISGGSG